MVSRKSSRSLTKSDIRGIIVPLVTPFQRNRDQDLDSDSTKTLVNYLIKNGVHGLMPLGTSGEFALLSREERKEFIRKVVETAKGRVPVIAGVSFPGTKNAIRLASDAFDAGADVLIATGPYYYKTNLEGLFLHYARILSETDLPLMIYNIPSWTGYDIPPTVLKKLYNKYPERLLGVKFTTNDLSDFLSYLRLLKDDISVLIGSDALIFSALGIGAAGAVVGSANVLPGETSQIYESYMKGRDSESRKIQARIDPFTVAMNLGTYPSALKTALELIGIDCGAVRVPLVDLGQSEKAQVRRSLSWKLG